MYEMHAIGNQAAKAFKYLEERYCHRCGNSHAIGRCSPNSKHAEMLADVARQVVEQHRKAYCAWCPQAHRTEDHPATVSASRKRR